MSLNELNRRVTNAIIRAESLPAGSRDTWAAFHEVSALEESIAMLVPPDDIDGEIARLGAVTAARSAGEPLRALQLAERFLAERLAPRSQRSFASSSMRPTQSSRAVTDEPTPDACDAHAPGSSNPPAVIFS